MHYNFDEHGNITPYQIHNGSIEKVKKYFVDCYNPKGGTRHIIWQKFIKYNKDLKDVINVPFKQLLHGGFISKKELPTDIDVTNLIPHERVSSKLDPFIDEASFNNYSTDGYIIPVYNSSNPLSQITNALLDKRRKYILYDDRVHQRKGAIEVKVEQ